MEAAQTHEDRATSRQSWAFPLRTMMILFIIYPLSVGPVAKLLEHKATPAAVDIFYKPLEMLYDTSQPTKKFFDWYIELWTKRAKNPHN